MTVVLTTHLLEEAERADRIAIMHQGKLVGARYADRAAGRRGRRRDHDPHDRRPSGWRPTIGERFSCAAAVVDGSVRLEQPDGHQWISRLVEAFPDRIDAITLGKPTLEDVFIHTTGHKFWNNGEAEESPQRTQRTRREKDKILLFSATLCDLCGEID